MRYLFALSILFGVAACRGNVETRVSSAGEAKIAGLIYQLPEKSDQEKADNLNARRLLVAALAQRDIRRADTAPVLLQITLSQRAADLGLKKGEGDKATVIATPKEKKPFQSCKDTEYRLGIRLSKISDGSLIYAGDAAEYHCKATFSEALPAMIDAIISDMGGPRGDKTLSRRGKE